jgi:probable rRNA maturation factor
MSARAPLSLSIQYASTRACPDRAQLRRWTRAALDGALAAAPEVAARGARFVVRFVDRAEGLELNRRYRGRHYATNVLTFAFDDGAVKCADIVLCAPIVEAEARAARKLLREHYAHLVTHGVLHALGYDHDKPRAAQRMERLEASVLARFHISDPY